MALVAAITRSVARAVIPKMFSQGYSATAGLSYFRSIGGQIRTKTWYGDWREIAGIKKLERTHRFAPRKYRLSYQMMAPTETFQDKEFKYMYDTTWRNLETDERIVKTQSMGSDTRFSPDDSQEAFAEKLDAEMGFCAYEGVMELEKVELIGVTRRKFAMPGMSEGEARRWYGVP